MEVETAQDEQPVETMEVEEEVVAEPKTEEVPEEL